MHVSIKNVDDAVFREFKAEAVREGLKIGKAVTMAMEMMLEKSEKRPKISLLQFKPKSWGKGTERTSEEIDKILY